MLNLEQDQVMGLDIGSSAVKIVQMRKDSGRFVVTAAGIADIAETSKVGDDVDDEAFGDFTDSYDKREANTVDAIRRCLESSGIQGRLAVCGVCGPEVAVRSFKFPSLPIEEAEGAVRLEAEQVCPFNVTDGAVDYQLKFRDEEKMGGVLVAATNKVVSTKKHLAFKAAVTSVLMDVDGLALLNCFSAYEGPEPGYTVAILNIGGSMTNLVLIGDDAIPFVRDLPYAGNNIIEQIATEHNASTDSVRQMLYAPGEPGQSRAQLEFSESLSRACWKLSVDVAETLRYYTAKEKTSFVGKLFVCGGFSLVKGFVELLDSQLPAAAVLWNPFDRIRSDADEACKEILSEKGPAMAVATGLAMRSMW